MAITSNWDVTGAGEFAAMLAKAATQVEVMVPVVVGKSAADLNALVKINASQRPGPNAPTGDYRGSWRVEPVVQSAQITSLSVGTDRPQANRLEYGFIGTDSLGRTYHQDPLPHLGPAEDVIDPIFAAAMELIVVKALNG